MIGHLSCLPLEPLTWFFEHLEEFYLKVFGRMLED